MSLQSFKLLLYPLPVIELRLFGERGYAQVFLGVALEDAGAYQEHRIGCCMYQRLRVVDHQFAALYRVAQPGKEVFAGWEGIGARGAEGRQRGRCRRRRFRFVRR